IISFAIIQLPPGDYLTSYIAQVRQSEGDAAANQLGSLVEQLRRQYGLDQPIYVQYYRWISNIVTKGDFGYSFEQKMPVNVLIWERLWLTVFLTGTTLVFTWLLAI